MIITVVTAGFACALGFEFVWDDKVYLLGNHVYQKFDLGGMLFGLANGVEYLPVRDISYALDTFFWAENPFGFHLTNLLLYALNGLLVYVVTARILDLLVPARDRLGDRGRKAVALGTALLFVVHPLHSEVVCFITCRNVLLSALFFFATCLFYLRHLAREREPDGRRVTIGLDYAAALACAVLSLLSKVTSLPLPGILVMLTFLAARPARRAAAELLPFFAVAAGAFFLHRAIGAHTGVIDVDRVVVFGAADLWTRLAVALQIPFFYAGKLLLPAGLSAEYTHRFAGQLTDPWVLGAAAILAVALVAAVVLARRRPIVLCLIAWYLLTLVPVLDLFATNPIVADRYAYLASFAYCLAIPALLGAITRAAPVLVGRIALAAIVATLAVVTIQRNGVWATERTLWESAIQMSPDVRKAHEALAVYHFERHEFDRAFELLESSASRHGDDAPLRYFRALHAYRHGDPHAAIEQLQPAMKGDAGFQDSLFLLGMAYEAVGQTDRAIDAYLANLQGGRKGPNKRRAEARRRLARLQAESEPHLSRLRAAADAAPDDLNARARLALALDRLGRYREALTAYTELEARGGDNPALFYNMGNVHKKLGRLKQAATYYRWSLALEAGNADGWNNLGIVCKRLGRYEEAVRAFQTAIDVQPDRPEATFNLAALCFRLGRKELALQLFRKVERHFPDLGPRVAPYLRELR